MIHPDYMHAAEYIRDIARELQRMAGNSEEMAPLAYLLSLVRQEAQERSADRAPEAPMIE